MLPLCKKSLPGIPANSDLPPLFDRLAGSSLPVAAITAHWQAAQLNKPAEKFSVGFCMGRQFYLFAVIYNVPGRMLYAIADVLSAAAYSIDLWHLIIIHCAVWLKDKHIVSPIVLDAGAIIAAFGLGIILYKLLRATKLNWLVRG
ncbi:MAG: hypothetical protein DU429_07345 [Candidatus Tokpelaia sp.]|nr:MAG: hypothetical protein DU430_08750 [Candidatus Tokpelaia sp.]KAA6205777.1 MAG: hypothetical protein DU429_07345 [Candidatus Tokpelaia sp.]